MPLEKQVVPVSLARGQETRLDRLLIQGRLSALQNGTLTKHGTIERRDGWAQIAAAPELTGLATVNDQLLCVDVVTVSTLAPSDNNALVPDGKITEARIERQQIVRSGNQQWQHDCATSGGLTCYVWQESTASGSLVGLSYAVLDEVTGATIVQASSLHVNEASFSPRVVALSSGFLIVYGNVLNQILARVILFATPTVLGLESVLLADLSGPNTQLDMCVVGSTGAVVYPSIDGTNALKAVLVGATGSTPSIAFGPTAIVTIAQAAAGNLSGLACASFGGGLWGAYSLNNGVGAGTLAAGLISAVMSATCTVSQAASLKDAAAAPAGGQNAGRVGPVLAGTTMLVYSDNYGNAGQAASVQPLRVTGINSANAVTVASSTLLNSGTRVNGANGPYIAGKPFLAFSGRVYLPVWIQEFGTGDLQNAWFLVDSIGSVMGRALYGNLGFPATIVSSLQATPTSAPSVSARVVSVPVGEKTLLSFESGMNVSQMGLSRLLLDFTAVAPVRAQDGANLFFAGGILSAYDGVTATEAGFLLFPEVVSVADGAAGSVDAGSHQFVALYEWIDGAGQRHQSAPSVAVTYVAPGAKKVIVTIPTLPLTAKAGVTIVVFRTVVNGTTFYRLNAVNAPIANTTAAATVTYTDNTTDANLVSGEILYTVGGQLPNNAPPACTVVCQHQSRLFIDSENPLEGRYSQVQVPGFGLQWNEALNFFLPAESGGIAGFASQDDRLVVFGSRRIYAIIGTGPTPAGVQNGYSTPQEIASDVGCAEPRSILRMPQGIIFKSAKGWHLLGRGLDVQYIGSAVESRNGDAVSAITLLEDRKEVRIASPTGRSLIFSYLSGEWSEALDYAAVDAVWWTGGGKYVHATAAGAINGDTPTQTDAGAVIPLTFTTAWLRPGESIHGFVRCWRFLLGGAYTADSALVITADFLPGSLPSETHTFAHSSALADAAGNWLARIHLKSQKFAAVQFTVTDTPIVPGPGLSFTSLALEVGLKRGAIKLPAGQSR